MMLARVSGGSQVEQGIGVLQQKIAICIGHRDVRRINLGIRRTDTGFRPHGNQEKQTSITGKERQYAFVVGDFINDQVNALGKHMVIAVFVLPRCGFAHPPRGHRH